MNDAFGRAAALHWPAQRDELKWLFDDWSRSDAADEDALRVSSNFAVQFILDVVAPIPSDPIMGDEASAIRTNRSEKIAKHAWLPRPSRPLSSSGASRLPERRPVLLERFEIAYALD